MAALERNTRPAVCFLCRRLMPPGSMVKRGGSFMCASWSQCRRGRAGNVAPHAVSGAPSILPVAEQVHEAATILPAPAGTAAPSRTPDESLPPEVFAAAVAFELGRMVNELSQVLEDHEPVDAVVKQCAAGWCFSSPALDGATTYPTTIHRLGPHGRHLDRHDALSVRRIGESRYELRCIQCQIPHIVEFRKAPGYEKYPWGWFLVTKCRMDVSRRQNGETGGT
ncbi:MAG: hypothetical protein ACYCW6_17825 [Candidatus Xenobia bacterium]